MPPRATGACRAAGALRRGAIRTAVRGMLGGFGLIDAPRWVRMVRGPGEAGRRGGRPAGTASDARVVTGRAR